MWLAIIVITITVIILVASVWYFKKGPYLYLRQPFANVWSPHEKKILDAMILKLSDTLENMGIDWFIAYGTLLGCIRSGDIIPWDDDADIFVSDAIWENYDAFSKLIGKDYKLSGIPGKSLCRISRKDELWPFVDIFFFTRHDTYVELNDIVNKKIVRVDASQIFPLRRSKFGDSVVNIPNDPHAMLEAEYGKDYMTKCVSSGYCHKTGRTILWKYDKNCF